MSSRNLYCNVPSHVGGAKSNAPFGEEPSPSHVNEAAPTNPKPSAHVNVHTLPKAVPLEQVGALPFAGAARAGQVMATKYKKRFKILITTKLRPHFLELTMLKQ